MGLKRGLILTILGMFILAACSEDPDILFSKAETEAALGSRQKALSLLMVIQQTHPEYTPAYLFAARLFYEDNNLTDAVNQCRRGLDAQADSSQILRYIGEIYHLSGSMENAYQYYRMAVQANPDDVDARISMGYILDEKDLYEQALTHFDKALELDSANYAATVGKAKTLPQLNCWKQRLKVNPCRVPPTGRLPWPRKKQPQRIKTSWKIMPWL
jgi:tetratricopeptide (TPR) repeat protein